MGFRKDAKSGGNIELLYRQKSRGHPCGWNLINKFIATTVPEELKGGISFKHRAIELAEETWGERKTTGELASEKKRWINMHKNEYDEELEDYEEMEDEEMEEEDEDSEYDCEKEWRAGESRTMVARKRNNTTLASAEHNLRGSKKTKVQMANPGTGDMTLPICRGALSMELRDILYLGEKAADEQHQGLDEMLRI